jgi:YD repeat-containing protein
MKQFLPLLCLVFSTSLIAQHNAQEIKQLKISKILYQSVTSDSKNVEKYDTRYDKNGNETAGYIDGEQLSKYDNQYNGAGKLTKIIDYAMPGAPTEIASSTVYTYQEDGSSTSKTTHNGFNSVEYKWYDKDGRLIKTTSADNVEEFYTYNASGKLLTIKTAPGITQGDIADFKYVYNAKGQRTKEISGGSYPWTRTYTYDAKGILIKRVTVSSEEGVTTTTTDTYKYEFWK